MVGSLVRVPGAVGTLILRRVKGLALSRIPMRPLHPNAILMGVGTYKVYSSSIRHIFVGKACRFPAVPKRRFSKRVITIKSSISRDLLKEEAYMFPVLPYFRYPSYGGRRCTRYDRCSCFNSHESNKCTRCLIIPA